MMLRNILKDISLKTVLIDIQTACTAKCFYCLHQTAGLVKPAHIGLDRVTALLSMLKRDSGVGLVCLYQSGEPFLHPNIYEIIRIARVLGIRTSIATKLHVRIDFDLLRRALSYNNVRTEFVITVDSLQQETMKQTAPGIATQLVRSNLTQIASLRDNPNVSIKASTIVSKLNENEIGDLGELFASLRIPWQAEGFGYYMHNTASEKDYRRVKDLLPSSAKFHRIGRRVSRCPFPETVAIDSYGNVSVCCHDMLHETNLGNVFMNGDDPRGFKQVTRSKEYREAKTQGNKKKLRICQSCN